MHAKPAPTDHPLHEIIKERWSPRSFAPDRFIDAQSLSTLLEAARWAPSCFNDQPWRFVVCNKATDQDAWQALLECLAAKNQEWAKNAPLLLLAVAVKNFGHNGKPNRWSEYDTGAAAMSLCLQAVAMGLAAHQMGGFDIDKCRERFGLPDGSQPMSVIAVGYQADADLLPAEFIESERMGRSRRPANESFHFGKWPLMPKPNEAGP